MKRTVIITAIVVIISSITLILFVRLTSRNVAGRPVIARVTSGDFEIAVSNTGELIAEKSVDIRGPNLVQYRNFRLAPLKITDMVPEGTIVTKGEYIGTIDRTNFNNTLKDESEILKTMQTALEMKLIDTAVILGALRDDIRNEFYTSEEAAIIVEQSKYEPPTIQRRAVLGLDKSLRNLDYKRRLYSLRCLQSSAEIKNLKMSFERERRKIKDINEILAGFTIKAPFNGMVIYKKERSGVKRKAGSVISPFDAVVATLPDLSSMLSRIYVSEIEVSKVKPGQLVKVTIDAFQGKKCTGMVTSVGNIGEQLSNYDSKVFEVLIKVDGSDPQLRPSMTTGNKIITKVFKNVLFVPVESVQAAADSIPYVYTTRGTRQVVVLGESNDKNIIIEQGLTEGASVLLSTPEKPGKFTMAGNELIPYIRERERSRKLELERERKENNLLTESGSVREEFPIISRQAISSGSGGVTGEF